MPLAFRSLADLYVATSDDAISITVTKDQDYTDDSTENRALYR